MPIDPNIALQFRSPQVEQVSPLQSIATLMQLRGQMAEIPLRLAQAEHARQQAAQEAIVTEQKNRQLQDESTLKEMMADPTVGPKIASGDLSPLNGKVQYDFQQGIAKNVEEIHKNAALASKDDLANKSTALNALAEGIQGLGEDPAQINTNLTAFKSNPANQLLFKNAGIDPSTIPTVSDAADLRKWEAGVGVAQAVTNKALALKESKAKEAETEANTGKAVAEAEHQNLLNKALKDAAHIYDPANGGVHPVDRVLPASLDPQLNASYKAAFDAAMRQPPDQNGRRPAVDTVLEQAAAHASALSPTLLKNKAATAAAEANAKIPAEVKLAQLKEPIEEHRALTVASVNRAQTGAEKLDTEYNDAKTAQEAVGRVIDLAESGNKSAGANASLMGVGAVNAVNKIRRMNSAEIKQYGTAGSLLDNIQGKLQGWTEGQPIPKDVLEDMRALHNELGQQAYEKYTTGLKSIEQRSGTKLPPTIAAPAVHAPAGKIAVISPEGTKGYIDADKWEAAQKRGFKKQ